MAKAGPPILQKTETFTRERFGAESDVGYQLSVLGCQVLGVGRLLAKPFGVGR